MLLLVNYKINILSASTILTLLLLMCVQFLVASFKYVNRSHSRRKALVIGKVLNVIYNAATEKILGLEFMRVIGI